MKKICNKHGVLKEEDIQIEKNSYKTPKGERKTAYYARCRICRREKDLKYKHDHRKERVAYTKKWKKENREYVNEWAKKDRLKNPDKYKKWAETSRNKKGALRSLEESLRRRHMDINDYNEMLKNQNNVCAICKKPETRKSKKEGEICRLMIDHCHTSNVIRGLLCHHCNAGLGHFKDDIEVISNAIEYIAKYL